MNKTLTIDLIRNAYALGNAAYRARNPESGTDSKDIANGLARFERFSAAQWAGIAALGIDASIVEGIANTGNVKVLLRLPQLIDYLVTGDHRALQGSAKTAVVEALAIEAGAKTRDALRFAATGKGDENTSDQIDVSKARAFVRALGGTLISASTEPTQNSVAFARGNLLAILGIAHKTDRRGMPELNRDSGLYRAIAKHVNRISERDLIALSEETAAKPKRTRAKKGA